MYSYALLVCLFVDPFARLVSGFSPVKCSKSICAKDRVVRRPGAPKISALGCNVTKTMGAVDRCCVEKEICIRTCGMPWGKCSSNFESCAKKICGYDDRCMLAAEAADDLITGGDSHMTVCKAYRDIQQEFCECKLSSEAKASANDRLASFYSAYKPDRLDEHGNVKDVEQVWKKWQGREPELFFELTRKYVVEAVDIVPRPAEELARWRAKEEEELARWQAEEEEEVRREKEKAEQDLAFQKAKEEEEVARQQRKEERDREFAEEQARRQAEADELARREAEAELARKQAEEELARRRAEMARLQAEKTAALADEDYLRAKSLKAQIMELDPRGEL